MKIIPFYWDFFYHTEDEIPASELAKENDSLLLCIILYSEVSGHATMDSAYPWSILTNLWT